MLAKYEIFTYDFHETKWGVSFKNPPRWVRKKYPLKDLSEYEENDAKKFLFITCQRKITKSNLPELIARHKLWNVFTECYEKKICVILDGSFETMPRTERYIINETMLALKPFIDSRYFRVLSNVGYREPMLEQRWRKLFRTCVPHVYNMVEYMREMGHEWPYNIRSNWSKKTAQKKHKFSTFVSSFSKDYRAETVAKIMYKKLDFFVTGHPITWNLFHKIRTKDEFVDYAETFTDDKFKKYYLKNLDKILDIKLYLKGKEIDNLRFFEVINETKDFDPTIINGPNGFRDTMTIYNMCDHNYDSFLFLALESNDTKDFLSEKSIRPMLMGLPFITLPRHNAKRYGYATYDKIFDYSFEEEPSLSKRIDNVLDQFEQLQKEKNLAQLVEDEKEAIEWNRKRVIDHIDNTDKFLDSVYHIRTTKRDPKDAKPSLKN